MKYTTETHYVNFPEYALSYLHHADPSGLDDADVRNIDDWVRANTPHGGYNLYYTRYGDEPFYTKSPCFGLPSNCVRLYVMQYTSIE